MTSTRGSLAAALCAVAFGGAMMWGSPAWAAPSNCTSAQWSTWQKDPGELAATYPDSYSPSSLSLGGDVVVPAGVIDKEFMIAPLSGGTGISGDSYWSYATSTSTWTTRRNCLSEIYLPNSSSYAFPWTLVSGTGTACHVAEGIWYTTSASPPLTYTQITPFSTSHNPTSFAVDSSSNVYTTGGNGTTCTGSASKPGGPCIQEFDFSTSTWSSLSGTPGAEQVTSGSSDSTLFALDSGNRVWWTDYSTISWTEIAANICGTGTLKADLIAANSGFVYAINDNSGSAGNTYVWEVGVSTCWSAPDNSVKMMSISANPQLNGESALLGTDASSNLWYYCNPNTP
jgi:hypothetical protein